MRGVDLSVFDFDYDLTWAGFFLGPEEEVYGRYGARGAESADNRMSLAGLRYAMTQALSVHRRAQVQKQSHPTHSIRTVEQYPAARRRPADTCIHCHHVYDFRREALQAAGTWRRDELWVYPLPENIGLTLEADAEDLVRSVTADSPADRAGLRPGDRLASVNGVGVSSLADIQYALHRAPAAGAIPLSWEREGKPLAGGRLQLASGWRQTDISWRWSLRGLEPSAWVQGVDLTAAEKRSRGISEHHLAFYQGSFPTTPALQAGIRPGDIILGIDGKELELTARQFLAYVKLHYQVGDRVTYNLLRAGRRLDVPLLLTSRPPF